MNTHKRAGGGGKDKSFIPRFQKKIFSLLSQEFLTSSAADFGDSDRLSGNGEHAGACAQGIWNSRTTK